MSWFPPDDDPLDAFRRGQQGIVKVVATIGPDCKPVACRTVVSSGVASLDEATCNALLRRARFEPSPVPARSVYHRAVWINPN
ncbi:TonB family protein [Sphingomonas sp. CV7422]|uniref:TonB family protein n=1 Tax=Sphingomonas sp. CV7422 TaxID=3018036 RepID=UPI0022FDD852|nr:TonB family protein [Sphingomonas sp. CV7422]